ncbi:MAG: cation:proton antiporter, partial [Dehalococcoidia bacterium]|nr:cation:proton antiporter [Dehalococcoidia bacterium]
MVIGYLIGGIVVGPYGLGLLRNLGQVQTLAEIGVVLLMFSLGVEFSLGELKEVRGIALIGGPIQIGATVALVAVFGSSLALPVAQAIFLGGLVALSSTLVVLKTLMARGELDSVHGRVLIGLLIVQDLAVVPLMIILPALATPQDNFIVSVGKSILQAAVVLGTVLVIGSRV